MEQPRNDAIATDVYERFEAYDFAGNEDFQAGLQAISQANPIAAEAELVLTAKLYYYSRSVESIDHTGYMVWQAQRQVQGKEVDASMVMVAETPKVDARLAQTQADQTTTRTAEEEEIPYPASFAEIVDLIKSGKPIPGIKIIPDQIAASESVSMVRPRTKPWEANGEVKEVDFF